MILWHCFGLRSKSIYSDDFGGNKKLEELEGRDLSEEEFRAQDNLQIVKTHGLCRDDNPAIYVVRNGKDASISLCEFYKNEVTLEQIIEGNLIFGTWAEHLQSWRPWGRPNTLLLKYEEMRADFPGTLRMVGDFLGARILKEEMPNRDAVADGRFVKRESNSKPELSEEMSKRFMEVNGEMFKKMGYTP